MTASPPSPRPPTLRLRVTAASETAIRGGHPWVYSGSVREQNRDGEPGELGVVFDRKDRFLAIGLYDPDSPLRLRVLHTGRPVTLDESWWKAHLAAALERRRPLFGANTTGFRWIHGESDGWPGLVLDRYDDTLVLKVYTAAWLPWLTRVIGWIHEALHPARLVVRCSRNIAEQAAHAGYPDGLVLPADAAWDGKVVFLENGLRLEADAIRGQKTGFFLDQRENRRRVEQLAAGRAVLNAFSFSGGFSLYAARGGARSATDVDISPYALEAGTRNFTLNRDIPAVAACPRTGVQADAFEWLGANPRPRFDLVVLDPPSLARREPERAGAIQAYGRLAGAGLAVLNPGGILVAASCSAHVTDEEFFGAVRLAAARSGRPWQERETTGHPPDHPAGFPEAKYLKCLYLELRR